MGVRPRGISNTFNELKRKNPKMTDTEAMERAIKLSSTALSKSVKAEKKTKEKSFLKKVGKDLKSVFGPGHSPAGRRYLAGRVKNK